ncbi:MAG TPA: hypothetical protein VEY07_07000 [Thermoplasmata archaeon]|nr:hypothetical protein [Thermoplasmata archaeon]
MTSRGLRPRHLPSWRASGDATTWVLGSLSAIALAALLVALLPGGLPNAPASARESRLVDVPAATLTDSTLTSTTPVLSLGIAVAPTAICPQGAPTCPIGVGEAQVELTAAAAGNAGVSWPAVQVAFVLETTSYDGDYGTDSSGLDPCATAGGPGAPVCEESNAIPFFVQNAQSIAQAIQAANPHSAVSFALADHYDAWSEPWDDQDGPEYNVDIGTFVPSNEFGALVHSTFQQTVLAGGWYNWDQDMDNNILDSSQITALYGAIIGSNLNWTAHAHHVIVWIGSTAPRDPSYTQNYCVSASAWNQWGRPGSCFSQSCEPSYSFPTGPSPQCEGWVRSQDGNPMDSIAALAHHAPACTSSVGGVCTVDLVDLWTTTTDPYSKGWPSQFSNIGGGPGGVQVIQNSAKVIAAGCDLAQATGGSWSGPAFASCPNGVTGTLQPVLHGPISTPNTNNPTLFSALRNIGFGPVFNGQLAHGTSAPMFVYVPFGNIAVAPQPQWTAACLTPLGYEATCQTTPTILHEGGFTAYGWNWSTNATANAISVGDSWMASFRVIATGPPYRSVPVDACVSAACSAAGSGSIDGSYTWAHYLENNNRTELRQSFPLGVVGVVGPAALGPPSAPPPPPPPAPPPFPVPVVGALPVGTPVPVIVQTALGSVSVQAATAGLLGAGFMRVTIRNRPIALAVAAKSGIGKSRFEGVPAGDTRFGRFE